MGTTHATLYRNPKQTYPWQIVGVGSGAHVVSNTWADEPKCYLMETDNAAAARYAYMHTPKDGQNPNISTYWECWFRLNTGFEGIYFVVCNQPTIQVANAAIRGYAISILGGPAGWMRIDRLDGAGAVVTLATYGWISNTDLRIVRFSREVSGANRFWRLYYGSSPSNLTLVAGPSATDATYTNFQYWGWDLLTGARVVFGGESCQS